MSPLRTSPPMPVPLPFRAALLSAALLACASTGTAPPTSPAAAAPSPPRPAAGPSAEAPAAPPASGEGPLTALPYVPGLDPAAMDRGVDPCGDFYEFSG